MPTNIYEEEPLPPTTSSAVGSCKRFQCQVVGLPRPSVRWYKDGVNITILPRYKFEYTPDGSVVLILENVTQKDQGVYECRAQNSEGSAETSALLYVTGSPLTSEKETTSVHQMSFRRSSDRGLSGLSGQRSLSKEMAERSSFSSKNVQSESVSSSTKLSKSYTSSREETQAQAFHSSEEMSSSFSKSSKAGKSAMFTGMEQVEHYAGEQTMEFESGMAGQMEQMESLMAAQMAEMKTSSKQGFMTTSSEKYQSSEMSSVETVSGGLETTKQRGKMLREEEHPGELDHDVEDDKDARRLAGKFLFNEASLLDNDGDGQETAHEFHFMHEAESIARDATHAVGTEPMQTVLKSVSESYESVQMESRSSKQEILSQTDAKAQVVSSIQETKITSNVSEVSGEGLVEEVTTQSVVEKVTEKKATALEEAKATETAKVDEVTVAESKGDIGVIFEGTDVSVDETESFELKWKLIGLTKSDFHVLKSGKKLLFDDRVCVKITDDYCIVTVSAAVSTDAGEYAIQVKKVEGRAQVKVNEKKKEPPAVSKFTSLQESPLTIKEGETITLRWKFTAIKTENISVCRNGKQISTGDGIQITFVEDICTVYVTTAKTDDAGEYVIKCSTNPDIDDVINVKVIAAETKEEPKDVPIQIVVTALTDDVVVDSGETFTLKWTITDIEKTKKTVKIFKDEAKVTIAEQMSLTFEDNTCIFTVKNASNDDIGKYTIKVDYSASPAAPVAVKVISPVAKVQVVTDSTDIALKEGDVLVLKWKITGVTELSKSLSILKNGGPMTADKRLRYRVDGDVCTLMGKSAKSEDAGIYSVSLAGDDVTYGEVKVNVVTTMISSKMSSVSATAGEKLVMEWTVTDLQSKKESIKILKDGQEVTMDSTHKLSFDGDTCFLTIDPASDNDKGKYTIKVDDSADSHAPIDVTVIVPDVKIEVSIDASDISVKEGEVLVIRWKIKGVTSIKDKLIIKKNDTIVKSNKRIKYRVDGNVCTLMTKSATTDDTGAYSVSFSEVDGLFGVTNVKVLSTKEDEAVEEKVEEKDVAPKENVEKEVVQEEKVEVKEVVQEDKVEVKEVVQEEKVEVKEVVQVEKVVEKEVVQEEKVEKKEIVQEEKVEVEEVVQEEKIEVKEVVQEEKVEVKELVQEEKIEVKEVDQEKKVKVKEMVQEEKVEIKEVVQEVKMEVKEVVQEEKVEVKEVVQEEKIEVKTVVQEKKVEVREVVQVEKVEVKEVVQVEKVEVKEIVQEEKAEVKEVSQEKKVEVEEVLQEEKVEEKVEEKAVVPEEKTEETSVTPEEKADEIAVEPQEKVEKKVDTPEEKVEEKVTTPEEKVVTPDKDVISPAIKVVVDSADITLDEGNSLVMRWTITGHSLKKLIVKKNGQNLATQKRLRHRVDGNVCTLMAKSAVGSDTGVYCVSFSDVDGEFGITNVTVTSTQPAVTVTVTVETSEVSVDQGQSLVMKWNVKDLEGKKDSVKILKDGVEIQMGDRCSLSFEGDICTLTITKSTEDDKGKYTIMVDNSAVTEATITAEVVAPSINVTVESSEVTIQEGNAMVLKWTITGLTGLSEKLTVMKNGEKMTSDKRVKYRVDGDVCTLMSKSAISDDTGVYSIGFSDVDGKFGETNVKVFVPSIEVLTEESSLSVSEGQSLTMKWKFSGVVEPVKNVSVNKDGEKVDSDDRTKITIQEDVCELSIQSAVVTDQATYTLAVGKKITDAGPVNAKVKAAFEVTTDQSTIAADIGSGFTITWNIKGLSESKASIKVNKDGSEVPADDSHQVTIDGDVCKLVVKAAAAADKGIYTIDVSDVATSVGAVTVSVSEPTIEVVDKPDLSVALGDNIPIRWKITGCSDLEKKVQIKKNGKMVESNKRIRYRVDNDVCTLVVKGATTDDEAGYTLSLADTNIDGGKVDVKVIVPTIEVHCDKNTVAVIEGEELSIQWKFSGVTDTKTVHVHKDGVEVKTDKAHKVVVKEDSCQYVVAKAKQADKGTYSLRIDKVPEEVTKAGKVTADVVKPAAEPLLDDSKTSGNVGDDLTVKWKVSGVSDKTKVHVQKDGTELVPDKKHIVAVEENLCSLTVKDATVADEGAYSIHIDGVKDNMGKVGVKISKPTVEVLMDGSSLSVQEGENFVLKWKITGTTDLAKTVNILKGDTKVEQNKRLKYRIDGDTCTLMVKAAAPDDVGKYAITITGVGGHFGEVEVGVLAPKIEVLESQISVKEGESFDLKWKMTNIPDIKDKFTVLKDGVKVKSDDRHKYVIEGDVCTCQVVSSQLGDSASYSPSITGLKAETGAIDVKVIACPKVEVTVVDKSIDVKEGETLTLKWKITGVSDIKSSVKIFKDGKPFQQDKRLKYRFDGDTCTLLAKAAILSDAGSYTIQINDTGKECGQVDVAVVVPKPEAVPDKNTICIKEGEQLVFKWTISGIDSNKDTVHIYKDAKKHTSADIKVTKNSCQVKISKATTKDQGYYILSVNGKDIKTSKVVVQVEAFKEISVVPKTLAAEIGEIDGTMAGTFETISETKVEKVKSKVTETKDIGKKHGQMKREKEQPGLLDHDLFDDPETRALAGKFLFFQAMVSQTGFDKQETAQTVVKSTSETTDAVIITRGVTTQAEKEKGTVVDSKTETVQKRVAVTSSTSELVSEDHLDGKVQEIALQKRVDAQKTSESALKGGVTDIPVDDGKTPKIGDIVVESVGGDITVDQGGKISLSWKFTGVTDTKMIRIYKAQSDVTKERRLKISLSADTCTMVISTAVLKDAATYSVRIEGSKTIYGTRAVKVNEPKVEVLTTADEATSSLGNSLAMSWRVTGIANIEKKIKVCKDGKVIKTVVGRKLSFDGSICSLKVDKLEAVDEGTYTLKVEDTHFKAAKVDVTVKQAVVTVTTSTENITVQEGAGFEMKWNISGLTNLKDNVQIFHNGKPVKGDRYQIVFEGETCICRVTSSVMDDSADYTISVRNGEPQAKVVVKVVTAEINVCGGGDVAVTQGRKLKLEWTIKASTETMKSLKIYKNGEVCTDSPGKVTATKENYLSYEVTTAELSDTAVYSIRVVGSSVDYGITNATVTKADDLTADKKETIDKATGLKVATSGIKVLADSTEVTIDEGKTLVLKWKITGVTDLSKKIVVKKDGNIFTSNKHIKYRVDGEVCTLMTKSAIGDDAGSYSISFSDVDGDFGVTMVNVQVKKAEKVVAAEEPVEAKVTSSDEQSVTPVATDVKPATPDDTVTEPAIKVVIDCADVNIDEGKTLVLRWTITGVTDLSKKLVVKKDNAIVTSGKRVKYRVDGNVCTLMAKSAIGDDTGIYSISFTEVDEQFGVTNVNVQVSKTDTAAKPEESTDTKNISPEEKVATPEAKAEDKPVTPAIEVIADCENVTLEEGKTLVLKWTFIGVTDLSSKLVVKKDTTIIKSNKRLKYRVDGNVCTLMTKSSIVDDTGVYYVTFSDVDAEFGITNVTVQVPKADIATEKESVPEEAAKAAGDTPDKKAVKPDSEQDVAPEEPTVAKVVTPDEKVATPEAKVEEKPVTPSIEVVADCENVTLEEGKTLVLKWTFKGVTDLSSKLEVKKDGTIIKSNKRLKYRVDGDVCTLMTKSSVGDDTGVYSVSFSDVDAEFGVTNVNVKVPKIDTATEKEGVPEEAVKATIDTPDEKDVAPEEPTLAKVATPEEKVATTEAKADEKPVTPSIEVVADCVNVTLEEGKTLVLKWTFKGVTDLSSKLEVKKDGTIIKSNKHLKYRVDGDVCTLMTKSSVGNDTGVYSVSFSDVDAEFGVTNVNVKVPKIDTATEKKAVPEEAVKATVDTADEKDVAPEEPTLAEVATPEEKVATTEAKAEEKPVTPSIEVVADCVNVTLEEGKTLVLKWTFKGVTDLSTKLLVKKDGIIVKSNKRLKYRVDGDVCTLMTKSSVADDTGVYSVSFSDVDAEFGITNVTVNVPKADIATEKEAVSEEAVKATVDTPDEKAIKPDSEQDVAPEEPTVAKVVTPDEKVATPEVKTEEKPVTPSIEVVADCENVTLEEGKTLVLKWTFKGVTDLSTKLVVKKDGTIIKSNKRLKYRVDGDVCTLMTKSSVSDDTGVYSVSFSDVDAEFGVTNVDVKVPKIDTATEKEAVVEEAVKATVDKPDEKAVKPVDEAISLDDKPVSPVATPTIEVAVDCTEVAVEEGKMLVLRWTISGVTDLAKKLTIKKDDKTVKSNKRIKYRVDGNVCTLMTKSATNDDTGVYSVSFSDVDGLFGVTNVKVLVPTITVSTDKSSVSAEEGDSVALIWKVTGVSEDSISVAKNGDVITGDTRTTHSVKDGKFTYEINSAVPEDNGSYSIQVNKASVQNAKINVTVSAASSAAKTVEEPDVSAAAADKAEPVSEVQEEAIVQVKAEKKEKRKVRFEIDEEADTDKPKVVEEKMEKQAAKKPESKKKVDEFPKQQKDEVKVVAEVEHESDKLAKGETEVTEEALTKSVKQKQESGLKAVDEVMAKTDIKESESQADVDVKLDQSKKGKEDVAVAETVPVAPAKDKATQDVTGELAVDIVTEEALTKSVKQKQESGLKAVDEVMAKTGSKENESQADVDVKLDQSKKVKEDVAVAETLPVEPAKDKATHDVTGELAVEIVTEEALTKSVKQKQESGLKAVDEVMAKTDIKENESQVDVDVKLDQSKKVKEDVAVAETVPVASAEDKATQEVTGELAVDVNKVTDIPSEAEVAVTEEPMVKTKKEKPKTAPKPKKKPIGEDKAVSDKEKIDQTDIPQEKKEIPAEKKSDDVVQAQTSEPTDLEQQESLHPKIDLLLKSATVHTHEGDPFEILWKVQDIPAADVHVCKDGVEVKIDDHLKVAVVDSVCSLTVAAAGREDEATYSIRQTDSTYDEAQVTVRVASARDSETASVDGAKPAFVQSPSLQLEDGRRLSITCSVTGFPEPEVTWFHHGEQLGLDALWEVYTQDGYHCLKVNNPSTIDCEEIVCRVENESGFVQSALMVKREGKEVYVEPILPPHSPDVDETLLPVPPTLEIEVSETKVENLRKLTMSQDYRDSINKVNLSRGDQVEVLSTNVLGAILARGAVRHSKVCYVSLDVLSAGDDVISEESQTVLEANRGINKSIGAKQEDQQDTQKDTEDAAKMPERRKMKSPSPQMTSTPKMKRKERETDSPLEDMKTRLGLKDKSDISLETVDISDYDDGTTRPMFSKRLRNVTAGAGEVAQLECVVAGTPQPRVLWLKNNRPLKATDGCKVMTDEGKNILCFPSANDDDVGTYTARAMNINGSAMSTAEFTLTSGKTLPALPLTEDMDFTTPAYFFQMSSCEVSEGRLARFDCRVVAYPKPDIVWMRDGKVIETADRFKLLNFNNEIYSLLIQDVKIEDTGRYTCWARNKFGEAMTEAYLNVIAFSEEKEDGDIAPKFLTRFYDQQITEGTAMDFKSLIAGRPEPTVTWLLDEIELRDTPGLRMRHKDGMISLEMKSPKMNQSGNYTCTIKNALGEATCSAKLTVIEDKLQGKMLPKFLKKFDHISAKENEEVKISCVVVGEPKPAVSWMFDHKSILETNRRYTIKQDGDVYTLTIKNARFDDAGTITCKAVNSEGEVYCSANIHVRESKFLSETPERRTSVDDVDSRYGYAPSFSKRLQDVQAKEGTKVKFECRFMGLPEPVVTWMKDGRVITDSDNYVVTRAGDSCQLEVERVSSSDTGVFTCIISNSKGKSSSTAGLKLEAAKKPTYERPKSAERTYRRERYTPEKKTSILEETRAAYKKSFVGTVDKAEAQPRRRRRSYESPVTLRYENLSYTSPKRSYESPVTPRYDDLSYTTPKRSFETPVTPRFDDVSYRTPKRSFESSPARRAHRHSLDLDSSLRDYSTLDFDTTDYSSIRRDYSTFDSRDYSFGSLNSTYESPMLDYASRTEPSQQVPKMPFDRPSVLNKRDDSVRLSWLPAPTANLPRNAQMISYVVESRELPHREWTKVATSVPTTTYTARHLRPDREYEFRIRASNVHGVSEPSCIAPVEKRIDESRRYADLPEMKVPPILPTHRPVITDLGEETVRLAWRPAETYQAKRAPPVSYRLEAKELPDKDWMPLSSRLRDTTHYLDKLPVDRDYMIRVRAENDFGLSEPTEPLWLQRATAFPGVPVSRPQIVEIEANRAKLSWDRVDIPAFGLSDAPLTYMIEAQEPRSDWRPVARDLNDTFYIIDGLKPETDYRFRVRAKAPSGVTSEPSPIASLYTTLARSMAPVDRLEVVDYEVDTKSVQLSWQRVEIPPYDKNDEPLMYMLEYQEPPLPDWKPLVTGIPTTRYRVMHLDPDRDYNFRVRALTSYGISAPSPALPVALHKPPVVRPVLDPITISDVEPDSLRLSWRRPMYDPAKPMTYQIEMLEPPSRDWRTLASSYTDLTYKVTGLKPTKDYQFRVVPHVESRYLDSTPIAAITSLPVRPRLPMFTPTIKETTPESVQLSWRPAELPAYQRTRHPVFYRIEMQEVPSSSWSPVARRIPETTYTVTGLRPDNDYRFRVVAETDHSSSEPSMAALLHRKPAPRFPIQEPCIKDLSPNVVMLSWQPASVPAGGEDVSYRVEIQSPPGISSWTTLYASHATPSVRLADLRPDLDYLVRVRATTRSGFVSEPTLPVYIPRRAVPPRMNAEEPYAIEITPDSVKLQWRSADLPTHITDYAPVTYLLEALELPSGSWLTVGKGIPHTDFRVTGLSPSKGYSFRVRAENSYGISDPTKATTVKPRSVGPILPSDAPLMYDIGPGSVKLTWRPAHLPCHVTSNYPITYTIYLQEEPFKSWRPYVRRVPHPSYSIYGLRPDVAYDFRVEAENEYGTSQPTESVYLPRYMENTRPISMPEVSDFDENLRSVKLQWKPSAQPGSPFDKSPRKYMIETWEPIKREWHTQARGISDTSYRLRDLPKTSEPIFRVRMESDQTGLSEPSLPVSLGKFYRYRVPVYRPQLFELDNESVRLSWEPAHVPEGTTGRARYIIEQREIPETRWSQVVSDITETSYRIKGLRPKSDYEFRVKVVIDGTKSEPSFPVSLFRRHVIPSVQLETPEVTEVDETSIGLKWRMVDIPAFTNRDEPLSFIIERQELPSYEWKTVAHDIKDSTYKVSGLKPYQDYNFRIRGIYPSGYTAPSPYVPVYRRPSESKLGVFGVENSISGAKYTAPKPVATQNVPTYTPPRTGQSSDYSALHRSAIHSRMSRLAKIYDLTETSFGGEASFKSAEPMKPIFKREDAYVYKRPLSPPPSFAAVPRASPVPAPEPKSPVKLEDKYNLYQMYRKTRRHSDAGLEDVQKSRERRKHFEEELELEERKLELLAESQRRAKNRQAKAEKPKVTFEHVQATTSEKYASVADRYEDIKCPFIAEHWSFPRRHSFSLDPEDIENMKRATSFNYKPKAASQTKRFMSKTDDDILVSRRHHGDHYFLVQDEVDLYNKGYLDPGYFVLSKFSLSVTGTKKRRAASPPARRTYEEHVRYPGYSSVSADRSRSVSVSQAEQIADWQALSKSISKQLDKAKTKSERSRSEYKSTSRAGSVYSSISESRARSNSFSEQARHTPSRDRPHFNPLVEKSKTLVGDYTRLGQRMQEQDSYRATSVSSETSKQRSMSVADVKKDSRFSYTPRASVSTVSGSSTPHRLMTPAPHSRASISVPSSAEKRGSFDVRSDSRFSEHRRATFTTATATDDIKAKLDTLNSQLKSTTTKKKKTKKVMKFKSSRGEGFVME